MARLLSCCSIWLSIICVLLLLPGQAHAFGAGTIKSNSALSNYNARHGDLANLLLLIPFAPGKFFTTLDVKRVYFGNWLRDYSQLFDVAGMTTIPEEILLLLVQIIAYMHFGYATDEFEVTRERLGVYRPEEHMDNPMGYPNNAQQVDTRLRGPVYVSELEYVNEPTNMKNYFNQSFKYIEEQTQLAIGLGRAGSNDAKHEAMRVMGAMLHCLEDFPAHTNYVELCLHRLATPENNLNTVFTYVGPEAPPAMNVKGPPIVSGTFGPLDMLDSLLGEVNDRISTGSISEFSLRTNAETDDKDAIGEAVKNVGKALGMAGGLGLAVPSSLSEVFKSIASHSTSFERADWGKANRIPDYIWKTIKPFFSLRDRIAMWIEEIDWKKYLGPLYPIAKFLGQLSSAVDQLLYSILGFILAPIVGKLRETLTGVRDELFQAQIQTEKGVFAANETNPSHSLMSKDHYDNILNVPASAVAALMTKTATAQITACWTDPTIPASNVVWNILSMVHHPFTAGTATQDAMFREVKTWWESKTPTQQLQLHSLLTPEAILSGQSHNHHSHPNQHVLITNPGATNKELGIPKEPNMLQKDNQPKQVIRVTDAATESYRASATNKILENLWHAHDNGELGPLEKPLVETVAELFQKEPSSTLTNPFDGGLALLPINPTILFAGLSASEIQALPTMGSIAKTGVLGALRDSVELGPIRSIKGVKAGGVVSEMEFADVVKAVRLLGPEAERVALEWEGMIRMVCRV